MARGKITPFTSAYNIMDVWVLTHDSVGIKEDIGPKISAKTFHELRRLQNYDLPVIVKIDSKPIELQPYGPLKAGEISVPSETFTYLAHMWEPAPLERIAWIPLSEQEVKRYFAELPYKQYYS